MVTQGDNGASKESIGNEPKIHLCGVIPNKLKHGGFGHRPSRWEDWFAFVLPSCVQVVLLHLDHSEFDLAFSCCCFASECFPSSCRVSSHPKPFPLRHSMQ